MNETENSTKRMRLSSASNGADDELNLFPVIEYLKSENGHEVLVRVVTIIDDVKKAALEKTSQHTKNELWSKVILVVVIIGASTYLTSLDKFSSTVGVLFGAIVGYLFGKKV